MTRSFLLVSIALLNSYSGQAEEPAAQTPSRRTVQADPEARNESEQKKLLQEMQSLAEQIKIVERDDKRAEVPMIPRPLFRYNSPSRGYDDGTIWGWGEGRPLAMMELWTRNASKTKWVHGVVLTSTTLVDGLAGTARLWQPSAPDVTFRAIPNAGQPVPSKKARLNQMKQLAGDFTGHQFWSHNNSRFELRRVVEPIHRYRDESKEIVDGAVFLMNHEIEPEVIILIEAIKKEGKLSWQYAVTPIGAAEFHIQFRGEEIYQRDREYGGRTKTIHFFYRNAKRE